MRLEFLALNGNRIREIENLKHLKFLCSLNLKNNLIEDFEIQEIPKKIVILNLKENKCINVNYH